MNNDQTIIPWEIEEGIYTATSWQYFLNRFGIPLKPTFIPHAVVRKQFQGADEVFTAIWNEWKKIGAVQRRYVKHDKAGRVIQSIPLNNE